MGMINTVMRILLATLRAPQEPSGTKSPLLETVDDAQKNQQNAPSPPDPTDPKDGWWEPLTKWWESTEEWWTGGILAPTAGILLLIAIGVLILLATRALRLLVIRPLIQRTKNKWDDIFVDQAFFRWISYLPPTLICSAIVEQMPGLDPKDDGAARLDLWIHQILTAATTFTGMLALGAMVDAGHEIWRRRSRSRNHSIKGYVSLIKLFIYILGTVAAVSFFFGRDPSHLLTGLGAMTAVLLLVFKDTILSLVASVTISQNDMIRLGDWVEMPGAADGDVVDIALHTVKIQNFDRTISTIPTMHFVDKPFKNWRNMSEGPGRRIKRSVFLDSASVRFLTNEEVERMGRIGLLQGYIEGKQRELTESNQGADAATAPLDVRRLTNIGTFRAYVLAWLKQHPHIHQGLTLLVRQLPPGPQGLPLEIYAFTKTTAWGAYEDVQGDLFDFLLAAIHDFDLRLFQGPTGDDLRSIAGKSGDGA